MKLTDKIIKTLENNGFWYGDIERQRNDEYYIDFGQHTPLGEDWHIYLFLNIDENSTEKEINEDFGSALYAYIDGFDVDEEAEPYIENRGNNGVPESISDLLEDAKWKLDTLQELYDDFNSVAKTSTNTNKGKVITISFDDGNYEGSQDYYIDDISSQLVFELIQKRIEKLDYKYITSYLTKEDMDLDNKLDNLCGGGQISDEVYEYFAENENNYKTLEFTLWNMLTADEEYSLVETYEGLASDYEEDAESAIDLLSAELYNCDLVYMIAICRAMGIPEVENAGECIELKEE